MIIHDLPPVLFCRIFHWTCPVDLIHYSWTCKSAYAAVQSYNELAFDLNKHLSKYFSEDEVILLRHVLGLTGALISGSTALQLFERVNYPESDLDIYVPEVYRGFVPECLRDIGYRLSGRPQILGNFQDQADAGLASSESHQRGILGVYDMKKKQCGTIQLISVNDVPIKVILSFHSTCVMNIITHNAAYSLFPHATFQQHRSLVLKTPGIKQRHARQKYIERGWRMQYRIYIREILNPRSDFHACWRSTSDERCWKIKLNPLQDLPQDDVEENHWGISYTDASTAKICIAHLKTRICTDNQAVSRHVFSQIVSSASS
ncbi:hypothetical protein AMATHDRAFT_189741 [Amanita thiersii Skay4041]|uniref:F-box domain-containing protein n=1 Tax=Amanita thiersii Skay4041 TaxID=703135 RepID=A0A2A9NXF1_9AGAR|nr:hypothetical protein AMATHDRAFT_189741 [Amanita thiersii Skay4041]